MATVTVGKQLTLFAAKEDIYIIWIQHVQVHTQSLSLSLSLIVYPFTLCSHETVQESKLPWWIHKGVEWQKGVTRHQGHRQWMSPFSCPSSQSILFLCTMHIWGLGNFPRLPPQIRPRHTAFCIFMCVPSYLNPSYYSHGWPCQGEICSLTVNGPILTARHRISDQCKGLAGTRFTGLKPNSMRRVVCRKTILAGNLCKC